MSLSFWIVTVYCGAIEDDGFMFKGLWIHEINERGMPKLKQ